MVGLCCKYFVVLLVFGVMYCDVMLVMFDEYYECDDCYGQQVDVDQGEDVDVILMGRFERLIDGVWQVCNDISED